MFRRILFSLLALLLTLGARPADAAEGWTVAFTHSGFGGEVTLRMAGDDLRVGTAGESQEVLLDGEGFTLVDHGDRSFMVVTYHQLESTLGLMADAMKGVRDAQRRLLESALEGMEAEPRAELQAEIDALGGDLPEPGEFEFRREEQTAPVAGLTARKHLVLVRGKPAAEVWLTPEIPLGPLPVVIERLERLAPLAKDIDPAAIRLLRLVDGFPLKLVDLTGRGESLVVHRAARGNLGPEVFSPPEGYAPKALSLDAFRN